MYKRIIWNEMKIPLDVIIFDIGIRVAFDIGYKWHTTFHFKCPLEPLHLVEDGNASTIDRFQGALNGIRSPAS